MLAYRDGNTFFHHIDPITKSIWVLLVSVWLISIRDFWSVVVVSGGVLLISVFAARINLRVYLRIVVLLLSGSVSLVFFQGLFRPGVGLDLWIFHLSYDGMQLGVVLALRTFGLVAASLAFSRTTKPKHMALALIRVGMPYRLAHVAYLGLRFLPLLEADMRVINDAQKLRGVKGGWAKIKKTMIALTATELRRAEETAIALETRAFGLYDKQTILEEITITKRGVILVAVTATIIIAQIIWLWLSR